MRAGVPVAALELMDETSIVVVNKLASEGEKKWKELPTLFFKFSGTKGSIADNIKDCQTISQANKGQTFEFARDEKEQHELWNARKQVLWSMIALKPEGTELWTTDVAVPFSRLAEIIGKNPLRV